MRKRPPKLALHKDTVRALATVELARAMGGADREAVAIEQSLPKMCAVAAAAVVLGG